MNRAFPIDMALALITGLAGALGARIAGMPLPWLLGPMAAAALVSSFGLQPGLPPFSREAAQLVIGVSIGARFMPEVAQAVAQLLPLMIVVTLATLVATLFAGLLLQRLTGVDRRTACYACTAAGVTEMAVIAHREGANGDVVAVVQLIRLAGIVMVVPLLVSWFGAPADPFIQPGGHSPVSAPNLVALFLVLAAATLLTFASRALPLPNRWLLVAAALTAGVTASDLATPAVPDMLLILAQVVIGLWIGCHFRRETLTGLPMVTLAAIACMVFLLLYAGLAALAVSALTDLPLRTSMLAIAPAGVTEMALTATAMHLDAATVTAFQMMRIAAVMILLPLNFRLFDWLSDRIGA